MLRLIRHRLPLSARLLLLALLALGVAGTPLASALADVHMLAHDAGSAHDHVAADADHADAGESAGAQLLHALVHCSHCHGHGSVLPLSAALALAVPAAQVCPHPGALPPLRGRIDSRFRPPIAV